MRKSAYVREIERECVCVRESEFTEDGVSKERRECLLRTKEIFPKRTIINSSENFHDRIRIVVLTSFAHFKIC